LFEGTLRAVPDSAGAVTTVPGVGLYTRGRPPAVNSGRDGAPPA
jgi:hypothetical protein